MPTPLRGQMGMEYLARVHLPAFAGGDLRNYECAIIRGPKDRPICIEIWASDCLDCVSWLYWRDDLSGNLILVQEGELPFAPLFGGK